MTPDSGLLRLALDWLVGVILVYSTLFGTGYLILGWPAWGLACITVALLAAAFLWHDLKQDRVSLFDSVGAREEETD